MIARSLGLHGALFLGAALLGLRAWTAVDEPNKKIVAAELWSARPTDVQHVEFRTDKKLVSLDPQQDAAGRYYVGNIQNVKPGSEAPKKASADAGAPEAEKPKHRPNPHHPELDTDPHRFISLNKADELVNGLATLKASRVLGKIANDRLAEFGFDKADQGTLEVTISGKKHELALGEKTPGGTDRYVRNPETGDAYVIAGTIANDLASADSRLVEREFHDFGDEKIGKVVLKTATGTREIVRHATEKDFWSRPETPETKDETVSNWMTKVDRLRVTNYQETLEPVPKPEEQAVRIEYFNDHGKELGFLELTRRPAVGKERPEYVAKSERTRWQATVLRSTAEQIDQDLASIMSP